jgi:hypothetical protein
MRRRLGALSLMVALVVVGAGVYASPTSAHSVAAKKPYVCKIKPNSKACLPHPAITPTVIGGNVPTKPAGGAKGAKIAKHHPKPAAGTKPVISGVPAAQNIGGTSGAQSVGGAPGAQSVSGVPGATSLPQTGGGDPASPNNLGLGLLGGMILAALGFALRRSIRRS